MCVCYKEGQCLTLFEDHDGAGPANGLDGNGLNGLVSNLDCLWLVQ